MKIGRGMMFRVVCALSLIVAAIVVWVWVQSFERQFHHISFVRGGERHTLKSKWGQFVLMAAPRIPHDDTEVREVASRMKNSDFEWEPLREGYVEGKVRRGTATLEMWEYVQVRQRPGDRVGIVPAVRNSLAGLDDPETFLSAHMLLLWAAEERRKEYFHRQQRWPEASISREADGATEMPVLFARANESGKGPDLSVQEKLREEWHDVLDEPRWAVFHGWVVLAAMVMPLAWLARPRWREMTWPRWAFNGVAVAAMLIFIFAVTMWVRSYRVSEQWIFASTPSTATVNWIGRLRSTRWIGSSAGVLIFCERDVPETGTMMRFSPMQLGYQKSVTRNPGLPLQDLGASGAKALKAPGVDFQSLPPQMVTLKPGVFGSTGRSPSFFTGFSSLQISWWLIVAVSAVAPLIWGWQAGKWWRRMRLVRLEAGQICTRCGYDMRATPERCPECGKVPTEARDEAPTPR